MSNQGFFFYFVYMLGRVVRKYFTTSDFAVWPPTRKNYPCHFLTFKGELQRTLHHVL